MDFREVKDFCKHAAPATKCPATYKDCNADNCPLTMQAQVDDKECEYYCPIVDKYRDDARMAKKELTKSEEAHKNQLDQNEEVQKELLNIINASFGLIDSTLFDLKDKLKNTCKLLEP